MLILHTSRVSVLWFSIDLCDPCVDHVLRYGAGPVYRTGVTVTRNCVDLGLR